MIAQVTSINFNVNKTSNAGKQYTVTEFSYQGQPYKGQAKPPTTRNVFTNAPYHAVIQQLQVGDWIELTFDQSQFKNIETITKVSAPAVSQDITSSNNTATSTTNNDEKNAEYQLKISRSIALGHAINTVNNYLSAGIYKKTVQAEILDEEILNRAKVYEKYLTLNDSLAELNEQQKEFHDDAREEFDQETFPE